MNTDEAVNDTLHLIDDAARDRVVVRGPDAASYLQSQIAQEIRDLDVGAARWTLVLDPTGKVDVLARIRRVEGEVFVLDTDAGFGDALLARINRFKIRVDAETTVEHAAVSTSSVEHELARISAGWPKMGAEIVPGSTIPSTTGIVGLAVNFQKGCYPGQELVERMDSRGADAPRSLRIVDLTIGSAVGDAVADADGNDVGVITSVSPDSDLGLAYVKRGVDVGRIPPLLA